MWGFRGEFPPVEAGGDGTIAWTTYIVAGILGVKTDSTEVCEIVQTKHNLDEFWIGVSKFGQKKTVRDTIGFLLATDRTCDNNQRFFW